MRNILFLGFFFALVALPEYAQAYIGPGAGFAFLGSGAVFLATILMALLTLLLWPLQYLVRWLRGATRPKNPRAKRVIILGLDGLDPKLLEKYMEEGKLPNFSELKKNGGYRRLGTTLPALSPVAWSTFQTGVNPGAHNIFDFLSRDKRFCLPELSAVKTETTSSSWKIWPFVIPRKRTQVRLMRRSKPFWKYLGDRNILANIIRVPISYPPEPFRGNILSAMCTPDLRGTQGTFSVFTTRDNISAETGGDATGGEVSKLEHRDGFLHAELFGPPMPAVKVGKAGFASVPLRFSLQNDSSAQLLIGDQKIVLTLNEFSPWITVTFLVGKKKVTGIVRMVLRECTRKADSTTLTVYCTPVNVDPAKPVLPISYPRIFSSWLAKLQGSYGTLGLLEDTWGRNELAIDDRRFLDQAYLAHEERRTMFFETLKRTRDGLCVCVFDASDRIQHMFWRYLDPAHQSPKEDVAQFGETIPEMYKKMDGLVGETVANLRDGDLLMVLSDHGFSSFRRCVGINAWLHQEGYLVLRDGKSVGADYLQDVDWSKTRAFGLGLAGLYINLKGRERNGIVDSKDAASLKSEILTKLEQLTDPQDGARVAKKVYDTAKVYRGLYTSEAPDLIVGYNPGYRVSWDSVTGTVEKEIFTDNIKAWSGDHHVDPSEVPGIFFCNRGINSENVHIADLAPTTLNVFGVTVPAYMEGKVVL